MIINEELAIRLANLNIKRLGISDEDTIQDAYYVALEMVGKEYSNPYSILKYKIELMLENTNEVECYTFQQAEQEGFLPSSTKAIDDVETVLAVRQYLSYLSKIHTLTKREIQVLYLRFWKGLTLEEASKVLTISATRVGEIGRNALFKMRRKAKYWNT